MTTQSNKGEHEGAGIDLLDLRKKVKHLIQKELHILSEQLSSYAILELLICLLSFRIYEAVENELEEIATKQGKRLDRQLDGKYNWSEWSLMPPTKLQSFLEEPFWRRHQNKGLRILVQSLQEIFADFPAPLFRPEYLARAFAVVNQLPISTPDERRATGILFQDLVQDESFNRYHTPRPIAELAVKLTRPKQGERIYDPCFANGPFLGEAADFIRRTTSDIKLSQLEALQSKTFFGNEYSRRGFLVGWFNLISNAILKASLTQVDLKDSSEFEYPHRLFDVIFVSPPFGKREISLSQAPFKARESELFYLMHVATRLKPGGRAAIILPEDIFSRGGKSKNIRQWLVEQFDVHTVISLPAESSSPKSKVKRNLLCFDNTVPTKEVWIYDLKNIGSDYHSKASPIDLSDIPDCIEKWQGKIQSDNSGLFSLGKISKNEYRLTFSSLRLQDKVERYFEALSPAISVVRLGSISDDVKIMSGITYSRQWTFSHDLLQDEEVIPLLRVADIDKGRINQPELYIPIKVVPKNKFESTLQQGDLLFSTRGTIGKMAICREEFIGAIPSHGLILIRCSRRVLPEYLYHYFQSDIGRMQTEMISYGSYVPYLSVRDFKRLRIPLPPANIQREVISGLDLFEYESVRQESLFEERDSADVSRIVGPPRIPKLDRDIELRFLQNDALKWLAILDKPSAAGTLMEKTWRTRLYPSLKDLRNELIHSSFEGAIAPPLVRSVDSLCNAVELVTQASKVTGSETLLILERARSNLANAERWLGGEMHPRILDFLTASLQGAHRLIETETERLLPRIRLSITCLSDILPTETVSDLSLQIKNSTESTVKDVRVTLFAARESDPVDIKEGETKKISQLGGHNEEILNWKLTARNPARVHLLCKWKAKDLLDREHRGRDEFSVIFEPESGPLFSLRDESASYEIEESFLFEKDGIYEYDILEAPRYDISIGNPYQPGGALYTKEIFKGREDIFEFLDKNLIGTYQNNVVVFQGSRKMGKSSILMQIEKYNRLPNCIPVYIDCQGFGELDERRLFYKIARSMGKALRRAGIPVNLPQKKIFSPDDSFYDFRELVEDYETRLDDRKILIMLDEFEYIDFYIQNGKLPERILENFRHLFQHHRSLAVILTGSHRLSELREEYWSVLFAIGLYKEIDVLDENSARELITAPLAGIVRFAPDAVDAIINLASCHPYFIQMVCHTIVENLHRSSRVLSHMVEEALPTVMERAQEQLNHMMAQATTPRRQLILIRLAERVDKDEPTTLVDLEGALIEDGISFTGKELEADLKALREAQFLIIEKRGYERFYSFKVELFRRWLLENLDPAVIAKRAREDI